MSISPNQISARIRDIASFIDKNPSPDRELVRNSLKIVLAALTRETRIARVAAEIHRLAEEAVDLSLWDTEDGEKVDEYYQFARRKTDADSIEAALKNTMHQIDRFIDSMQEGYEAPEIDNSEVVTSVPGFHDR